MPAVGSRDRVASKVVFFSCRMRCKINRERGTNRRVSESNPCLKSARSVAKEQFVKSQPGAHLAHPSFAGEDETRLIRALGDRYRCSEEFLRYYLGEELSANPGYFELGSAALCFGRLPSGVDRVHLATRPQDGASNSPDGRPQVVLPFDPDEVIDNLRLERYAGCQLNEFDKALKQVYYRIRHLTNLKLRGYVQRFRAANWKKRDFPQWPVDTTVENISEALLLHLLQMNRLERIPFIWFWPDGAQASVTITHDVETLVGRDMCAEVMDLDESYGFRSSFQIIPEGRYAVSPEFLTGFRDRGFELCVQDFNHDGRLFDDLREFRRRAALINRFAREHHARGFRSAVLYRNPEWFEFLDFSFDMSMPNVAHLDPQRGGCCTVTPYFIGDMVELPLTTTQDYTLFHILKQRSVDLWKLQIEIVLAKNGLITLLVHPDYIIEAGLRAVYKHLLATLVELRAHKQLWFALPSEIAEWWRKRNRMTIVENNNSWRITGEGSDRARLAFARIVDGRLIYELARENEGDRFSSQAMSRPVTNLSIR